MAKYKINVYPDVDVDTDEFMQKVNEIENITYVFVCLGNDSKNTEVAVKMRSALLRRDLTPIIYAVIYDSEKQEALDNAGRVKKENKYIPTDISYVGDLKSVYSDEVIINSKLEDAACARHLKYSPKDEASFWKYEYNYRSSMASAVHVKIRTELKIPGADNVNCSGKTLTELRIIEHNRWVAYMHGEGYRPGAKKDHIQKTHHLLKPFGELLPEEKKKDDVHEVRREDCTNQIPLMRRIYSLIKK